MYNSVNKIKTNEYVKRLYGSCKTYNFWWWEFFADTVRDSENALTSHAQWRILPQVILYNNGVAPVHAVCPACMCALYAASRKNYTSQHFQPNSIWYFSPSFSSRWIMEHLKKISYRFLLRQQYAKLGELWFYCRGEVYRVVHVIISFPAAFSLKRILFLFTLIPKAGWDAKK